MAAFNAVDDNNDGIIGANQLGRVLKLLGENPTDAVLQVINFFITKCANGNLLYGNTID